MKSYKLEDILITGLGVTSAIGQGKNDFTEALLRGESQFAIMQREGRQFTSESGLTKFLGAELSSLTIPENISKRVLRSISYSGHVALATLSEAWHDASLEDVDPERVGLIVGGSNFQQRELVQAYEAYKDRVDFFRPTYGLSFMDTDICGVCTEQFNIRGMAFSLGGASASGQLAVIQAFHAVQSGQVDFCIALGALMDLSFWECHALRSLGAMGSSRFADEPSLACRPFDKDHDGFIYGENCGAVVVEKASSTSRANIKPYAVLSGCTMAMDANRNPDSSYDGEVKVIRTALEKAQLAAKQIDYVNPHGTGSTLGDPIELKALKDTELSHAKINATKSVTGHGLSAAGIVEVIASLVQMQSSQLHPTCNLEEPIDDSFNWVKVKGETHVINNALNLSYGFGGINTAICLQNL